MRLKLYGNGTIFDAKNNRALVKFERRSVNFYLGHAIVEDKDAERVEEMGLLKPELEGKVVIGGWEQLADAPKPKKRKKKEVEEISTPEGE